MTTHQFSRLSQPQKKAATTIWLRLCIVLAILVMATPALARKLPKTIVHSPEALYEIRQRILERDPTLMLAYRQLLADADRALKTPVASVVFKPFPPPGGKQHDYWSIAPYWWPNPDSPIGLPYIRRDGERNPESLSDKFDRKRLRLMADNALTLALAWYLSGNEQYAGKGAAIVWAWCGDSVTRMSPHMEFAQTLPGKRPGSWESTPYGLIEGKELIKFVEAARILEPSHGWTRAVSNKVIKWFEDYVEWMQMSRLGRKAANQLDNHGTWYDAQLAVYSLFIGNEHLARSIISTTSTRRIIRQIERNGAMPRELERTRSRHYTFFNLAAFFTLASVGERLDMDIWNTNENGTSIRRAFDYAAPYLAPDEPWPFGDVGKYDPFVFTPLFHRAAMVYKDDRYHKFLTTLPREKVFRDRAQLLY